MAEPSMHIYKVDINQQLIRRDVGILATNDSNADRFGVELTQGGAYCDASGYSVFGYFIRPDMKTVLVKGKAEGNTVYVDLSENCYVYDGAFVLSVKIVKGEMNKTILLCDGILAESRTGVIVDEEHVVPSLEEVLAKMAEVDAAANNANAAAAEAVAAAENANSAAAGIDTKVELAVKPISGTVDQLVDDVGHILSKKYVSENALDLSQVTADKRIQSDGSIGSSSTHSLSDYIEVKNGWIVNGYITPNTIGALGGWFDEDKSYCGKIEDLPGYELTDQSKRYFTLKVDFDGYIRLNIYTAYIESMVKINANVDTSLAYPLLNNYVPYEETHAVYVTKTGMESRVDLIRLHNGLFSTENVKSGYLANNGTQVWSNERYVTSDYIAVYMNRDYVIQGITTRFCLYDDTMTAIDGAFDETITANRSFNAGNASYARFTYFATEEDRMYFRPAEEAAYDTLLGSGYIRSDNPLLGKTLVTLGDSIMEGNGNGNFGIGDIIASRNAMALNDCSKGGATIAYREDIGEATGNIQYQARKAITDGVTPDYILINGQTNDLDKIGTNGMGEISSSFSSADFDTGTFAGGMETIFHSLKTAFPAAKIVYVRVHHIGSRNLSMQDTFGATALGVCGKWGVPVVDLYEKGQLNTFLDSHVSYTYNGDKTHPTREGYDTFYINPIEATMKNN